MNFSKYFNNTADENKGTKAPETEGSLEQILAQISGQSEISLSDMLASIGGNQTVFTTEAKENMTNKEWFEANYGEAEEFLFGGYMELKEPYEDAIHKAVGEAIRETGSKETPVLPAAAMVSSSKDLLAHVLIDGLGLSQHDFALRCAAKSKTYTQQMSSKKVDEQLINIFSALAAVDLLMSEVVATSVAENRILPNKEGN